MQAFNAVPNEIAAQAVQIQERQYTPYFYHRQSIGSYLHRWDISASSTPTDHLVQHASEKTADTDIESSPPLKANLLVIQFKSEIAF